MSTILCGIRNLSGATKTKPEETVSVDFLNDSTPTYKRAHLSLLTLRKIMYEPVWQT